MHKRAVQSEKKSKKKKRVHFETQIFRGIFQHQTVKQRVGPKNRVDFKAQLCSNTVRDQPYLGRVRQRLYNGIC